ESPTTEPQAWSSDEGAPRWREYPHPSGERLKALLEGRSEAGDGRSELVRLAARLIIEEGLDAEAADAVGRGYYEHGALPGMGYRNGSRTGQLKTAEGAVEYAAPQICDRSEPYHGNAGHNATRKFRMTSHVDRTNGRRSQLDGLAAS